MNRGTEMTVTDYNNNNNLLVFPYKMGIIFAKDWSNLRIDKETESLNFGQKKLINWTAY